MWWWFWFIHLLRCQGNYSVEASLMALKKKRETSTLTDSKALVSNDLKRTTANFSRPNRACCLLLKLVTAVRYNLMLNCDGSATTLHHACNSRCATTMWQEVVLDGGEARVWVRCRGTAGAQEERRGDRRTSRHCFMLYSVRAGGSCCNSLPNVDPGKEIEDIHEDRLAENKKDIKIFYNSPF